MILFINLFVDETNAWFSKRLSVDRMHTWYVKQIKEQMFKNNICDYVYECASYI